MAVNLVNGDDTKITKTNNDIKIDLSTARANEIAQIKAATENYNDFYLEPRKFGTWLGGDMYRVILSGSWNGTEYTINISSLDLGIGSGIWVDYIHSEGNMRINNVYYTTPLTDSISSDENFDTYKMIAKGSFDNDSMSIFVNSDNTSIKIKTTNNGANSIMLVIEWMVD